MTASVNTGSRWIPALDGYRALAALTVLVFHILSLDSPTGMLGRWTIPLGNTAVTVFFVLSGFLIYRPFVAWAFGDGPPVSWWRFIIRRSIRILALYWVVVTVYFFVLNRDISYTFGEYATAYLLVQNFRGSMVFIPPFVAWSLCIELWFSVALPFLAAPVRWLGAWRPRHHRFRIQLVGVGLLALAAVAFREWALQGLANSGQLLWVPAYLDWFAAGLVLAVLSHHWSSVGGPRWARQIADNPWILGTVALVAYWVVTRLGLPGGFISPTPLQTHLQFSLQALVGLTIIASATFPGSRIAEVQGLMSAPLLTRLGSYGYGIYLIHSLVIDEIVALQPDMNRLLLTAIALPVTIAFSMVGFHLVEQPTSRLANRRLTTRSLKPLSEGLLQWTELPAVQAERVSLGIEPPTVIAASASPQTPPYSDPSVDPIPLQVARPMLGAQTKLLSAAADKTPRQRGWFPNGQAPADSELGPGFSIVDVTEITEIDEIDNNPRADTDAEELAPATAVAGAENQVDGYTTIGHGDKNTALSHYRDGNGHNSDGGGDGGTDGRDHGDHGAEGASGEVDLVTLARSTREIRPDELPNPGSAWVAAGDAFVRLGDARDEVTPTHRVAIPDPLQEMTAALARPWVMALALAVVSVVTTILAAPGRYVADARFELFADPVTRLQRMFVLWDPSRDLGRVAEEFWPGVTLAASAFAAVGLEPWLSQRLLHALLITLAATGAMALSRTLRPRAAWPSLIVAVLYAFGPFSAIYLIPSTLYVNHALAPWLVVAVLRAGRGPRTLVWAGATTVALFLVGNADAPGLIFACVPAALAWLGLAFTTWRDRPARRRLGIFTGFTVIATLLASAPMLAKTSIGASALALRLLETESVDTVAATTSFTETLRGMGLWLNLFQLGPVALRSHQLTFVANPWGVAITFVPVLAAVLSLIWWRRRIHRLALAWIITGVILAVGPHPVDNPSLHGRLLLRLYESSDLAFGFRSTHKAGTIIALGVAVLGGWALAAFASWPARRLRSLNRAPLVAVVAALAILTQPFWFSPLYDPEFQTDGVANHWEDLGAWFDDQPPVGKVLVLPGSTNNGYHWGRIGDDVLDPLIPNRVVASTLPLSTLPGADVIRELDRAVTSPDYQAGSLLPLARRLGITTVVIRNDLDWQLQGLPSPSNLNPLRSDTDLELIQTFGQPGQGGAPEPLPPIEVYGLNVTPADHTVLLGEQQTILIDGATPAALDLAKLGLLDGGHTVRYAPAIDRAELEWLSTDVALVVLGDSLVAEQRRVSHYGYYQMAAEPEAEPSPWLPGFAAESFAWPTTSGSTVGSTVDRWLLTSGQADAASDNDFDSGWFIPFLVEDEPQRWWVDFDETQPAGTIEIDLADNEQRLGQVKVAIDDVTVDIAAVDGRVTIEPTEPYQRLTITLPVDRRGQQAVGIREVRFDGQPLVSVATLSTRLPDRLAALDSNSADLLRDVPLLIRLGPSAPSPSPWRRTITLWRDETMTFSAQIDTESSDGQGCLNDLLSIDGQPVLVRLRADGVVAPCVSTGVFELDAGSHTIELRPGVHEIGMFGLFSASWAATGAELEPITHQPVAVGDLLPAKSVLTTTFSYDDRWRARIDGRLVEPVLADGLTSFMVPGPGGRFEAVVFPPDQTFNLSLYLGMVGLLLAGLAMTTGRWTSKLVGFDLDHQTPAFETKASRLVAAIAPPLGLGLVYWFIGPWGVGGALVVGVLLRLAARRWTAVFLATLVGAAAVVTLWPTLSGLRVDPTTADFIGRMLIAGLVTVLVFDRN